VVDPVVSVVIPARDSSATIGKQLGALSSQSFEGIWEVIVVDDASQDDTAQTVAMWRERVPGLTILSNIEAVGICRARNIGIRASRGRLIACCDDDDLVSCDWLENLVRELGDHDMATGPIDLSLLNPPKTYKWHGGNGWERLPDWYDFLPAALSCNLGFRREVFDGVNGFDEMVEVGGDHDFVWRAQLNGAKLGFAPGAVVHKRLRTKSIDYFKKNVRVGRADPQHYARFAQYGFTRPALVPAVLRTALLLPALPYYSFPTNVTDGWQQPVSGSVT
jgi:glycosyltransferase involved in cell wall biosynthesis